MTPGEPLELEISGSDSDGIGLSGHDHPDDRLPRTLKGYNNLCFGTEYEGFLRLPVIP